MICDATGWKATLAIGGPEPGHDGRLNIVTYVSVIQMLLQCSKADIFSVNSGETTGEVKLNFGRSERAHYKEHFLPMFGTFLKKCYSMCFYNTVFIITYTQTSSRRIPCACFAQGGRLRDPSSA